MSKSTVRLLMAVFIAGMLTGYSLTRLVSATRFFIPVILLMIVGYFIWRMVARLQRRKT